MLIRLLLVALTLCALACMNAGAAWAAGPFEPNDSPLQAYGPLAGGQNYDGKIETTNDADYFYFNVDGQRQLDISLTRLAACDISLALRDAEGGELSGSDGIYVEDSSSSPTGHLLRTIPFSSQYVLVVDGDTGCTYRVNVAPADALTTTPPGVVVRLGGNKSSGADDVQKLLVDGALRGQVQGSQQQDIALGDLPAASQIMLQATSSTGGYSWSFLVTDVQGRGRTTLLSENVDRYSDVVGVVRQVTISRSGAVLASCGEQLAPVSCIAPPPVDNDGDGFPAGVDCDDTNPNINPNAKEIRGNQVDENCDGRAEPFSRAVGSASLAARRPRRGRTEIRSLVVRDVSRAFAVQVRCSGRGCRGAANRTTRARPGSRTLSLTRYVRGMKLRPGSRLSVKVYRSGYQSKTFTFRTNRRTKPRRTVRCANPGSSQSFVC